MSLTIYHNPRCSKSRKTLEIIREAGLEPEIVEYLQNPPSAEQILRLAGLLGVSVAALVRSGEAEFLADRDALHLDDDTAMATWIAGHPQPLQRPVVVDSDGNRAVIGRPPENVLELIAK